MNKLFLKLLYLFNHFIFHLNFKEYTECRQNNQIIIFNLITYNEDFLTITVLIPINHWKEFLQYLKFKTFNLTVIYNYKIF